MIVSPLFFSFMVFGGIFFVPSLVFCFFCSYYILSNIDFTY